MTQSSFLIEEAAPPPTAAARQSHDATTVLRLFHHHVYEYGRGVRALFLMTINNRELELVLTGLEVRGIPHFVQELSAVKANIFFGRPAFVAVAQSLVTRPLNTLTAEEDFMLGTLLGYDCEQQCRRFLTRSGQAERLSRHVG